MKKRRFQSSSTIGVASVSVFHGRNSSVILGSFALLIMLLTSLSPRLGGFVRMQTYDVFAPVVAFVSSPFHAATDKLRMVSGIANLQAENANLQAENARLRDWYNRALELQTENQSLRTLLNVVPDPNHSFVSARVISDTGYSFAKTLMLTGGREDNIAEGQAVLSGDGLIGRVIETSEKAARVLLVTDMNSRVPVYIEGINQHAVMAGQNGDRPALLYLPPEVKLKTGHRVITSGYGGLFPQGLPVGVIDQITQVDKDGNVKHVPLVRLYTDFNALLHVRVVDMKN